MKRVFSPRDFIWFLIPLIPAGGLLFFHFFIFSQTLTERGIKYLKKKQPRSAVELFLKILEKEPFHPYTHLNLGLSYDISRRPAQALKEYNMVSKYFKEDSLRFFSSFNTAELQGRLGNVETALESYQKALSFSMEPIKVKQNIELLLKAPQSGQGGGAQKSAKGKNDRRGSGKREGDSSLQAGQKGDVPSKESPQTQNPDDERESGEGGEGASDSRFRPKPSKGTSPDGEVSADQAESIMDEIEELESAVRAKQFQQKSKRRRRRQGNRPDW